MPTFHRAGRVLVRMYRDHNPPHFHISTPDGEAQVSLEDFTVMRGRVDTRDYEVAMTWVRGNIDYLRREWKKLNG